jgi:hypothetical protein
MKKRRDDVATTSRATQRHFSWRTPKNGLPFVLQPLLLGDRDGERYGAILTINRAGSSSFFFDDPQWSARSAG